MSKNQKLLFLFTLFSLTVGFSQKKSLKTQFTSEKIVIDANFDEPIWKNVEVAKDFVMWDPDNGKPENPNQKTEVKVVYDNEAIYVAATLFDSEIGRAHV